MVSGLSYVPYLKIEKAEVLLIVSISSNCLILILRGRKDLKELHCTWNS